SQGIEIIEIHMGEQFEAQKCVIWSATFDDQGEEKNRIYNFGSEKKIGSKYLFQKLDITCQLKRAACCACIVRLDHSTGLIYSWTYYAHAHLGDNFVAIIRKKKEVASILNSVVICEII
ncbi:hypothetical protein ACJX0J_014841, partial [Zea mays]